MTDSDWDTFGCSSCGRNFSTQDALTKHVNSPDHPFKCALCKTHYADIVPFRLHLELAHLGYMCTFGTCPYWSATESDVDKHSQQHPQYQKHAGAGEQNTTSRGGPPMPAQKRWEVILACDECRRKKTRCDFKQPCTHCSAYSYECTYAKPSNSHGSLAPQHIEAGFKARKFGNQAGPEQFLKTGRRKTTPRNHGEHPSSELPGGDQPRKKDAVPTTSSAITENILDVLGMPCPFRLAVPEPFQYDRQDTYAVCRTLYKDISSLIRHLSHPVHGLEVIDKAVSSFDVESKVPPVQKAGICKRCWKIFRTAADLSTHMAYPCAKPKLHALEKRGILYDAFARTKNRVDNTAERVSTSNTTQTSPNLTEPLPSMHSSAYLPKLEESFMRDFTCCDRTWPTLHDLLQHYEEDHAKLSEADRVKLVSGKPHPARHGVADPTEASTDRVESTLKASPSDLEEVRLPRGSRQGAEEKFLPPRSEVEKQALEALDSFVLFPQHGGGQTGFDNDELFDPNITISTASPNQTAVSPSNDVFAQRLQAANNHYLTAVHSPASAPSRRDGSVLRQGSPLAPGPNLDPSSTLLSPSLVSSSAQQPQHFDMTTPSTLDHWAATPSSARDNAQVDRMEAVYCHACSHEWYRDREADLQCPHCHGTFSEIVIVPNTRAIGKVAGSGEGTQKIAESFEHSGSLKQPAAMSSTFSSLPRSRTEKKQLLEKERVAEKEDKERFEIEYQPRLRESLIPAGEDDNDIEADIGKEMINRSIEDKKQTSKRSFEHNSQQQSSGMMLPDPMSIRATAPNFGLSHDSPYVGMPEDFMAYLFNTNTTKPGEGSPRTGLSAPLDMADNEEVIPMSGAMLPPFQLPEYAATIVNDLPSNQTSELLNADGDQKVLKNGQLLGGRKCRIRTFLLPTRGDTLFMLVHECMDVLGYQDMQAFLDRVPSCFRVDGMMVATLARVNQGLLEGLSGRTQVWVVEAIHIFQQFGWLITEPHFTNPWARIETQGYDQRVLHDREPLFAEAGPNPVQAGLDGEQSIPTATAESTQKDDPVGAQYGGPLHPLSAEAGLEGEQNIFTTAESARKDDLVGASQPSVEEIPQDNSREMQKTYSAASQPSLYDLESNAWTMIKPDDLDADESSFQSWHSPGRSFAHPESSVLPRQDVPGATAQTDSGYASVLREKAEGSIYGNPEPGNHPRQEIQAVTAQTDSGYASHTREKEVGRESLEAKEPSPLADTDAMTENNDSDAGTIYSDDRSQASVTRTQCYISEFVDHLFGKIRHQMEDSSAGRLMDCLPELLQAFALKVGQSSATRGHFEVMYFVHKHRRAIALSLQDRVKQDEAHGLAEVEDRGTDLEGMSLDDKLSLWAQKASNTEPEHEFEVEELPEIELFEDELDTNELYRYQSLIMKSPAFDWLVGSLQREIQLGNSAVVGMMDIRRRILQGLPSPRHVSRKQAVPCVQFTFTAPWDPVSFIEEQGYDPDIEDILGRVITLTGSSADVQAASCEQYLCQTWPSTGRHMLRIIGDTCRKKDVATGSLMERRTYILPDNTRVTATCMGKTLILEASGTAYSMAEIGEQLGWLVTALRSSPDESRMAVLYPTIGRFQRGADPSQPFSCDISTSFVKYEGLPVSPDSRNGECWHRMFRNPVVVWGYPIPRRQELVTGTGLEIPLDMLVALTDASGLSEFDGKTFIKGYSAMLIPTEQVDDLILWHLLFNDDGRRISYTDCRLATLHHIETTGIKQARHILGWVSHARNNTGSPGANYHIKWSGLGKPRERHAWEKVIISGGDPVGVSASFVVGKKDKGIFAGALGGYTSRLKFIAKQYVVLYDLADRRAWLVDGLSALLHLVRASLEHDQRDVFNSFFLYKRGQIKECSATMHGLDAAAAVLFNRENYSLKLYTESEDTWDEETERQQNGVDGAETVKEVVSKRKVTYYCLRDKVLEIFSLLEKMVDHLNNVQSEAGVGFRLRGTPRNILEGFDFMDVATSGAPLRPHMIKLNICESGRGWTDLLRSIQAITLFGKGFGELITPTTSSLADPPCGGCGYGIALPTGKDYLATCVSVIERILTTRGNTETVPWCLADDIYWHTPGALFDPCQCVNTTKGAKPSDRVQVLLPSTFPKLWGRDFASPNNLESQGAVIFSHNWRVPFRLGHQSTQDQKMLEPPDSGLGTSIDSSSGRSQLSGSFDDSETQASNAVDGSSVHSTGSQLEVQSVPNTAGLALMPDNGTSSRKRKLVEMVDRVKRKVLKTSPNIELDQFPDGGTGHIASSSMEGAGTHTG